MSNWAWANAAQALAGQGIGSASQAAQPASMLDASAWPNAGNAVRYGPYGAMRPGQKQVYMTDEAMRMKNRKRKLWLRYVRSQDPRDYDRFVRIRNDLRKLTRNLRGFLEEHQEENNGESDQPGASALQASGQYGAAAAGWGAYPQAGMMMGAAAGGQGYLQAGQQLWNGQQQQQQQQMAAAAQWGQQMAGQFVPPPPPPEQAAPVPPPAPAPVPPPGTTSLATSMSMQRPAAPGGMTSVAGGAGAGSRPGQQPGQTAAAAGQRPGQPLAPPGEGPDVSAATAVANSAAAVSRLTPKEQEEIRQLQRADELFDKQFKSWEEQFNSWKQENRGTADASQLRSYENEMLQMKNKLLQRRDQLRRRLAQKLAKARGEEPPPDLPPPAPAAAPSGPGAQGDQGGEYGGEYGGDYEQGYGGDESGYDYDGGRGAYRGRGGRGRGRGGYGGDEGFGRGGGRGRGGYDESSRGRGRGGYGSDQGLERGRGRGGFRGGRGGGYYTGEGGGEGYYEEESFTGGQRGRGGPRGASRGGPPRGRGRGRGGFDGGYGGDEPYDPAEAGGEEEYEEYETGYNDWDGYADTGSGPKSGPRPRYGQEGYSEGGWQDIGGGLKGRPFPAPFRSEGADGDDHAVIDYGHKNALDVVQKFEGGGPPPSLKDAIESVYEAFKRPVRELSIGSATSTERLLALQAQELQPQAPPPPTGRHAFGRDPDGYGLGPSNPDDYADHGGDYPPHGRSRSPGLGGRPRSRSPGGRPRSPGWYGRSRSRSPPPFRHRGSPPYRHRSRSPRRSPPRRGRYDSPPRRGSPPPRRGRYSPPPRDRDRDRRSPFGDRRRDPYDRPRDPYDRPREDRPRDPFERPRDRDPFDRPRERDPYDRPRDDRPRDRDPFDRPRDPFDRPRDDRPRDPHDRPRGPDFDRAPRGPGGPDRYRPDGSDRRPGPGGPDRRGRPGGPPAVSANPPPPPVIESLYPTVNISDLLQPPGRLTRPTNLVIVLRGPPGSGKTYTAKLIKDQEVANKGSAPRILSLDDYFCTEKEKTTKDPDTGKSVTKKVMEYEYDAALEEAYRASLLKVFKKTVDDGFFHFIIVDCVNEKTNYYDEMCTYATSRGFKVYVAEMDMDVATCHKRNTHGRSLDEIREVVKRWQPTPRHYIRVDVRPVLQDDSIQEVEMEDTEPEPAGGKSKEPEVPGEETTAVSKWEKMDPSEERLDKLDGVMGARKRKEAHPQTMQDYLSLPDDYESRSGATGKKRVRWADVEEKNQQRKMRDMGFVVGQTDWNRMTDPTFGESALTKTKYI